MVCLRVWKEGVRRDEGRSLSRWVFYVYSILIIGCDEKRFLCHQRTSDINFQSQALSTDQLKTYESLSLIIIYYIRRYYTYTCGEPITRSSSPPSSSSSSRWHTRCSYAAAVILNTYTFIYFGNRVVLSSYATAA